MAAIDTEAVKRDNEAIIRGHGGQICEWLPCPDPRAPRRDVRAVARRALVLNAMLQIAFQTPIPIIKRWISENGLDDDLVESERAILDKSNAGLAGQERANLFWHVEALWALAWAGASSTDCRSISPPATTSPLAVSEPAAKRGRLQVPQADATAPAR